MYRVVYLFILLFGNIYSFSVEGTAECSRTLSSHQVTNKVTGIRQDTKETGLCVCVRVGMCVCVARLLIHVHDTLAASCTTDVGKAGSKKMRSFDCHMRWFASSKVCDMKLEARSIYTCKCRQTAVRAIGRRK